jgi:DtxR family manganese transport transcriptional regulator
VQRLQRDWLVESRPHRSICLTEDGRAIAEMSRPRHRIVQVFLTDRLNKERSEA